MKHTMGMVIPDKDFLRRCSRQLSQLHPGPGDVHRCHHGGVDGVGEIVAKSYHEGLTLVAPPPPPPIWVMST